MRPLTFSASPATARSSSGSSSAVSLRFDDDDGSTSGSRVSLEDGTPHGALSPSPSPRSAAFASLSRMHLTRAAVADMVRYLQHGETPATWSRARAWKFRQKMDAHTWRVEALPASVGAGTAASDANIGIGSAGTGNSGPHEPVLYVQLPDPSADGHASPKSHLVWLRVLPAEGVDAALHALYVDPAQGSLRGARALYERALQRYVGVTMRAAVAFLKRQETAQAVQPKQGYLVVQPADVQDVGHWQADLTDVPLFTKSAAKHLLVCVDTFSKFAWAAPLASKHAANVTAALEAMWLSEGPPLTLRTDGGTDMSNADVAALCRRYDVSRKVCAPYNSQCNGGVERLHRTLKDALSKAAHEWMSSSGTVDWLQLLPQVLYGYNTSVHRTTGFTPFYLQRGRAPRPLGPLPFAVRATAAAAGPDFHKLLSTAAVFDIGDGSALLPAPSTPAPAPVAAPAAAPVAAPAPASGRTPASRPSSASHPAASANDDAEYTISRVLATRQDPARKVTRYWVRWAGFAANQDSWITPAMAGVSDTQLQAWIRRTHRGYMPVALPGPFVTPAGRQQRDVPVTEADRAALQAALQPALDGGGCDCDVDEPASMPVGLHGTVQDALQHARATVRLLEAAP